MEHSDGYTLVQISEWIEKNQVKLPTVQRGSVWKPNQIENLWDSLLRGYPAGSFVLSYSNKSNDSGKPLDILDGQQRVNAICIGFGKQAFRHFADQAKVFIDIGSSATDNRKYMFRAITKSHPWGYLAIDNSKPLESDKIRKALERYEVLDHLDAPLERFFPYDAVFPVPFDTFLNCAIKNEDVKVLIKALSDWEHWKKVYYTWNTKASGAKQGTQSTSQEEINRNIVNIYNDVILMLHGCEEKQIKARTIPALYLNFNSILDDEMNRFSDIPPTDEPDSPDDVPKDDNIETLFIRLNAGGTPLRGEELNYSILKAKISPDRQEMIEKKCYALFTPARFITIAYRLFQACCSKASAHDAITMKIKPKQFQKTMADKQDSFIEFLNDLITVKEYEGRTILEYLSDILLYGKELNPCGLPYLVASKLSSSAPEVIFMLMYRLKKGDRFSPKDKLTDVHQRMLGMLTLFAWLGKGEKLKDHAKLLSNVWPAIDQKADLFWTSATVQRAMLDGVLPQLPTLVNLNKIERAVRQSNSDIWARFEKSSGASSIVISKIFFNKDLILFAQRQALSEWFDDRMYHLDDTNVPFDWDHIFPNRYVKRQQKIPKILREIYNTNGNFRAWPYPLNRGDQDVLPLVKLNPNDANTEDYQKMVESWQKYFKSRPRIDVNLKQLKKTLLEWSKCSDTWIDENITNVKKNSKQIYDLIVSRNIALCKEWYEKLHIDDLISFPEEAITFDIFMNNSKWGEMPKKFKDRFEDWDGYDFMVSSPFKIKGSKFYLYLCLNNEDIAENLKEDAISFGAIEEDADGIISELTLSSEEEKKYQVSDSGVIENSFTLISFHEQHYLQLFAQFHDWLIHIPVTDLQCLANYFLDCLKSNYKKKVSLLIETDR